MESVWRRDFEFPSFPTLDRDLTTDVLIIGGGIAGILTAQLLAREGIDCVLVEKNRLCSGNTQNTTAKITVQHGLIYHQIAQSSGLSAARKYYLANRTALSEFEKQCREIDCDFEMRDNFVYSLSDRRVLQKETSVLNAVGCPAEFCESVPLPVKTVGAVKVPDQAQFHPLKFLATVSRGLPIYEHTFVREMLGNNDRGEAVAKTDRAKIRAKRIVVATHFPFLNKHGAFFLKLYQHRSYTIALRGAPPIAGMFVDEAKKGMSFRAYGDLLLLCGGDHRTGKQGGNWAELRAFAKKHYPNAEEVAHWAAQDCMSLDGVPYIGQYARSTPNFFVATGFNKWGMTSSMVAAMILRDLLIHRKNESASIFDPSRSILKPQLFLNGLESVSDLLLPLPHRCPHLGCALRWNAAEHTWDCPCHGSRFAPDGTVLDNPANGNLSQAPGEH